MTQIDEALEIFANEIDDIYCSSCSSTDTQADNAVSDFCSKYNYPEKVGEACSDWLVDVRNCED